MSAPVQPGELRHLTFESVSGADGKFNREAWLAKFQNEYTTYQLGIALMKYDDKALEQRVREDIEPWKELVDISISVKDDLNERIRLLDAVISRLLIVMDRLPDGGPEPDGEPEEVAKRPPYLRVIGGVS